MAGNEWARVGKSGDLRRIFRKGTSPGSLLTFQRHVHGVNGKPGWVSFLGFEGSRHGQQERRHSAKNHHGMRRVQRAQLHHQEEPS